MIDTNAAPNNTGSSTSTVHTVHTPVSVPTGATGVLVTYTEGQTTTTFLDSGVTLADSDPIKSATVSVSGPGVLLELNRVEEALASYGRVWPSTLIRRPCSSIRGLC